MINTDLVRLIRDVFPFAMTSEQENAVGVLSDFLLSDDVSAVFLLNGYAGTGKTSLVSAVVKALSLLRHHVVLLAPTGRAAKIFAMNSGHKALTVHKKIYRQKNFTGMDDVFSANVNLHKQTLFMVDEASLISDVADGSSPFGTDSLLDDLIQYVYSAEGCRLMLIGDEAQLPPVGGGHSKALSAATLSGYGLKVYECRLQQVVRQKEMGGILWNATMLRHMIVADAYGLYPQFKVNGFPDVRIVHGDMLIEELERSYSECGYEQTVVVTRSNKRANIYNNGIRNRIIGCEDELCSGDRLLVVKNNYYWAEQQQCKELDFIANGDMALVRRVRKVRELYGLHFADVLLKFTDYEDTEFEVTVILDTLQAEAPALSREQSERLFHAVEEDYADVRVKRERLKKVREDVYYNALQVKYAYALTCHKSQGGQWRHVYVDLGFLCEDMLTPDFYRWLYTAFTRATDKLFLVNWPSRMIDGNFSASE